MKYHIRDIISRLQKYSASLDQSSFLVDKPWVVANNTEKYQKLIFRRDGRVHISYQGDVKDGSWEYLPEAESLIIDYGDQKKLYRHQYLDEAVLALKPDGIQSENDHFLLANEKIIPNLDVENYLESKYLQDKNINQLSLDNGKQIEIFNKNGSNKVKINSTVKINNKPIKSAQFYYKNGSQKILVENGKVTDLKKKVNFGNNIYGWVSYQIPEIGDRIEGIKHGTFDIAEGKYKVIVKDGVVTQVKDNILDKLKTIFILVAILTVFIFVATLIFN